MTVLPPNVIDGLDSGVIVVDDAQQVVVWNSWMAAKSCIPAADAKGSTLAEIFPVLNGSHLLWAINRALGNRLSTVMSHNLHRRVLPLTSGVGPGAEPMEQSVVIRPLVDGDRTACLIQVSDITAAVKRDRHLREVTVYNRTLFALALDPMATVDTEGYILDANPAFETISNLPRHKLIGSRFQTLFTDSVGAGCLIDAVLTQGKVKDYTLSFLHGGEIRHVSMNAATVPAMSDGSSAVFLVARDLTERIEAEQELAKKTQVIERSNAELAEFAYVVSHDLRQPLRMVSSFLSLIERRLGSNLDSDIQGFIEFAVNGAKRMDRLILDLLNYSRIGRLGPPFELLSLAAAVEEAQDNLRMVIQDSHATITISTPLPQYFGCQTELVRLFQNLIDNAIKYAAPDRPPVIEIGAREESKSWVLWVRDNGVGIPADCLQRIFGLFQRLVAESQKEGTGIGLAVCRKIIDHHQGRIWVESQLDLGSCFYIELPKSDNT